VQAQRVGSDARAERQRIVEAVRFCVVAFLGLRITMSVIGLAADGLIPSHGLVPVPGWTPSSEGPGWFSLLGAWERFDALWFLRIAETGYSPADESAAFFPLFPMTTRVAALLLGRHYLLAATLVSNAAFLGGIIVTYLLTATELSERHAKTTVLMLCLFPTSYFFLMPYSESLFFLLAVTAFWGARQRRWAIAGLAAALAALTRGVGLVLTPALVIEAFHQRTEGRGHTWPGLAAAAGPIVAVLCYLGLWGLRSGDWLLPFTRQSLWGRNLTLPFITIWDATKTAFTQIGETDGGYWLLDWLIVVPMLVASVYAVTRLRLSYSVYLWGGLLIPLTFAFEGRPFMSLPRFLLPLFPAFWGLALLLERLNVPRIVALVAGAVGLGILATLTVNWYFVF
jgi:hypothetical protein